jgi:hypothetical protein
LGQLSIGGALPSANEGWLLHSWDWVSPNLHLPRWDHYDSRSQQVSRNGAVEMMVSPADEILCSSADVDCLLFAHRWSANLNEDHPYFRKDFKRSSEVAPLRSMGLENGFLINL